METFVLATDPTRTDRMNVAPPREASEDAPALLAKAERCRRLSAGISDRQTSDVLTRMAMNYEDAAHRLKLED